MYKWLENQGFSMFFIILLNIYEYCILNDITLHFGL